MSAQPVTLDMSTAQPLRAPVKLDMSTAQPIASAMPGAPPPKGTLPNNGDTGEGPVAREMTSFEAQLSKLPEGAIKALLAKHWPLVDAKSWNEFWQDFKSLNPIVKNDTGATGGVDVGATAANLLPLAVDVKGGGITESPAAGIVKGVGDAAKPAVRLAARGAETAINQKLVPVQPILNLGKTADEAASIPIKVPGRDFGLPQPIRPVYPGAPLPEHPGVFPGAPFPANPLPEQINPAIVSPARTLPGMISPEVVRPPAGSIPARPGLQLTGEVAPTAIPQRYTPPSTEAAAAPASEAPNSEVPSGAGIPRTLSGESALRQILPGNKSDLMAIAKSRGLNTSREAQLMPTPASRLLIDKIVNDFSDEELSEVGAKYLENTRMGHHDFGDIEKALEAQGMEKGAAEARAQEAWNVMRKQTYFPELNIPAAQLKRAQATMQAAAGFKSAPTASENVGPAIQSAGPNITLPPGATENDLTPLLQESLRQARARRAALQ